MPPALLFVMFSPACFWGVLKRGVHVWSSCCSTYQTPKVELIIKLEDFKKQLSNADLDTLKEEKSLSLFTEVKKMISEERKRRRYLQQLKNKKRLANVKTKVKLTRKQKRLVDAESVIITNGITTESQEK